MIQIYGLSKIYDGVTVLDVDQISIPQGQLLAFLGPVGSGKTTLLKLLLDLIPPSSGFVINRQIQVSRSEEWKLFTSGYIGDSFLIGYLSVKEYLYFIASLRFWSGREVDVFLRDFASFLTESVLECSVKLGELSRLDQKKVGLVAALMGRPGVVVLDEPYQWLDASSQKLFNELVLEYAAANRSTVVISASKIRPAIDLCRRVLLLSKGKVIRDLQVNSAGIRELENCFLDL